MRKLDIAGDLADRTIPELLKEQARIRGEQPHAHFPGESFTFAQLHEQATQWARALIAIGVQPGDHVATLMPNCASWVPVYYGILYAGAAVAALNSRYKRQELSYTLAHSRAKVLITTDAYREHADYPSLIRSVLPDIEGQQSPHLSSATAADLKAIVICGQASDGAFISCDNFLQLGGAVSEAQLAAAQQRRGVDDTAAIIYTSGTTANPKGCELTHGGIQNCWSTFARIVNLKAGETVWMPMPFFHTGGIGPMTTILSRGAAFATQPHFEADGVVDFIDRLKVDHLYPGFPQLTFPVLEHPRFDRQRHTFVRSLLNVGPPAMQQRAQSLLPDGAVLLNLFGMTEGSGIVTFTPWDAPLHARSQVSGLPPPHTDVRVVDPETLQECPVGVTGEIQFRGAGAFKSYYRDPAATAATIIDGGWVRTGDRGRINEDGYLMFLGRIKDTLKVGGENVAAAEIEAFLQSVPGVRLAQVIGMPDERMGEVPVAFIERIENAAISETDVIKACDGELARWKIPRRVVFVTEWPMSATKVQKFRLKELLPRHA